MLINYHILLQLWFLLYKSRHHENKLYSNGKTSHAENAFRAFEGFASIRIKANYTSKFLFGFQPKRSQCRSKVEIIGGGGGGLRLKNLCNRLNYRMIMIIHEYF